ncbi:MAG: ureidoglycolate lyase [Psychromonas sp.]
MRAIEVKKANKENFKAYGQLLELPTATPTGETPILSYWKQQLPLDFNGGKGEIGYLVAKDHQGIYAELEAHLETAEILIPLNCAINIAVITPLCTSPTDKPDTSKAEAFQISQGQPVLINKGVWHWLPQPAGDEDAHIAVIFADNTSEKDMIVAELDENNSFQIK